MKKIFFWLLIAVFFISCNNEAAKTSSGSGDSSAKSADKKAQAEFADPKYVEMGKKSQAAFAAGDIDGWIAGFADNAVYAWNSGDSLAGKAAITDYWKKRRAEVIDSIVFSNHIWLPIKVNQPQSTEAPGVWLLSWYQTHAKYKTGKSMTQWMHMAMHFNSDDKIDRAIAYLDRAPINEATKK